MKGKDNDRKNIRMCNQITKSYYKQHYEMKKSECIGLRLRQIGGNLSVSLKETMEVEITGNIKPRKGYNKLKYV